MPGCESCINLLCPSTLVRTLHRIAASGLMSCVHKHMPFEPTLAYSARTSSTAALSLSLPACSCSWPVAAFTLATLKRLPSLGTNTVCPTAGTQPLASSAASCELRGQQHVFQVSTAVEQHGTTAKCSRRGSPRCGGKAYSHSSP